MFDESKIFTRRTFLKSSLALSALLAGCSGETMKKAAKNLTSDALPDCDYLRQIVTGDIARSRTIMWQSNAEQKVATVVITQKGKTDERVFKATSEHYTDDAQNVYLHTAKIDGLNPASEYEFYLKNGGEKSKNYPLTTPGEKFKLIVFPDTQSSDYSTWKSNAEKAAQRESDAVLFANIGDLVDNGEEKAQWNAWLGAVEPLAEKIPFAPVMGNHECYDKNWDCRIPEAYLRQFAVPKASEEFDRWFYSFDVGCAHFVVLNTQWNETDEFKPGLLAAELNWLYDDIAKAKAKWKIALFHKDVLRYAIKDRPNRTPGVSQHGQELCPSLEELGFDLVLTAHLHTYRNRGRLKEFERNETGPAYILTGVAGNAFYNDFWIDHELDLVKAPQPETGNYLTLTVDEKKLLVESFLFSGQKFDELALTK